MDIRAKDKDINGLTLFSIAKSNDWRSARASYSLGSPPSGPAAEPAVFTWPFLLIIDQSANAVRKSLLDGEWIK